MGDDEFRGDDERPHIGAMLRVVSNWVRDEIYAAVFEEGFNDLNPAHLAMFRYPGLDGMHPSQMAVRLQVTKQAVNSLVGHLEAHGYVVREPNPVDGRGRIIRLTSKGRRVEAAVHDHAREIETRITGLVGARGFGYLRSELEKVFRHVTETDTA